MVAPAVEGIDLFKIVGRSISGWMKSLKTGTTSHVRQPFCNQLEERLLLWLEYHPQVVSYARGDIGPQFATTYRLPTPHVLVANPGRKTMGIVDFVRTTGSPSGTLPGRSYPTLAVTAPKNDESEQALGNQLFTALGLPLRGRWSERKPKLMGHLAQFGTHCLIVDDAAELLTLRRDTIRLIDGAGPHVEVAPSEVAEQGRETEPDLPPEHTAQHANHQQNTTKTVGERQVERAEMPKCTFSGVVSIEPQRFLDSGITLIECPDCARTRSLSPRKGVLRFPSHDKRKTRTPNTEQRWAMEKTICEVVGGERK